MTTYLVTTELKTFWWWKVLRFFRLKSKREEFEIAMENDWFDVGELLSVDIQRDCVLIIKKY